MRARHAPRAPDIPPGQLFRSLATVPLEVIEQVIDQTSSREHRSGLLPIHLVVCLIIALSLWSHDYTRSTRAA